jgi:nucleotide-binding universal stress UspA family protein
MDLIIDVALAPTDDAKLTPLEVLRDFAYASPSWHYLEDASRHYAGEKGREACILRHHVLDGSTDVDLAFSSRLDAPMGKQALHLTVIEPGEAEREFDAEERDEIAEHFLEHLRAHLDAQGRHADLHVERGDAEGVKGEA